MYSKKSALLEITKLRSASARRGQLIVPILLASVAISFAACGKAGNSSMSLKSPAMGAKEMPVKSSYVYGTTKTFTDIDRKISTAGAYEVFAANYDLDAANFGATLKKSMTADDQVRVTFSLVGDQCGNEKSPIKAGDYSAKADKFMKVESVAIVTRKGGQDTTEWLDRNALTGSVKVTSVSGDAITGEADLASGESAVKGPFTARILLRK
jgi:hypothetical protein